MTWWKVSTEHKKCVFEHEIWQKDDLIIRRVTGFRWGTVLVKTEGDEPPVFEETDDGIDMYNTDYECELDSLDDGWFEDFIWPDNLSEEEQERLLSIWEEDYYSGWEGEGWVQTETECYFHGPLEIVKDGWEEPEEHEWIKAEITPELQDVFQEGLGNKEGPKPIWPFSDPETEKEK